MSKKKSKYISSGILIFIFALSNIIIIVRSNEISFDIDGFKEIVLASPEASANLDPSPLVDDIYSICAVGVPGPLWALSEVPIPVAAGDEDTTPVPSVVAMASEYGSGRVVALGHDGFFTNEALDLCNNKKFGNNIVDWLDKLGKKKILVTTGHGEWYGGSNFDDFGNELENRGYTVTRFWGTLDSLVLSDWGLILIGTAWDTFSESEIDVLKNFVAEGGGVLLTGLGWSWELYNPGSTLDDYPMNKIGEIFGIRWIDGYISDSTNNYNGQPIFHTFYLDIELGTVYQAFYYIKSTTETHLSDLPSLLQDNPSIRLKYTNAHLLLAMGSVELSESSAQRQEIYDFYEDLIGSYPQYFQKNRVYDKFTESTMAWIRERIYRSLIDALPLTDARRHKISTIIKLTGRYLDIWNDFSVLLLDNTELNQDQKEFIYTYLSLVPKSLHNLRSISVVDFLGSTSPEITLQGSEGSINILGVDIGGYSPNSFPDDVAPGVVDGFCIVVVHELNHVVDAFYIGGNASLTSRRDALIASAGETPLNYLRSMLPEGFFANNPQEFFASIANQWFTNSTKTVELGLIRFDATYPDPINQALFFAEVYSMGRGYTYFYNTDNNGDITRYLVQLTRNTKGQIDSLTLGDTICHFKLDADGNVMAYVRSSIPNWAVLQLLPATKSNKAGRTMPVKFSLRTVEDVDPAQSFVVDEELTIKIYVMLGPGTIGELLQESSYGEKRRDYRIDSDSELYITNFKTLKQPKTYIVKIYKNSNGFFIGSFTFKTVK